VRADIRGFYSDWLGIAHIPVLQTASDRITYTGGDTVFKDLVAQSPQWINVRLCGYQRYGRSLVCPVLSLPPDKVRL
jgi:hypothetical protein